MTDIEILLYAIGGLSVVALVWSTLDARRRKSREKEALLNGASTNGGQDA